MRKNHILSATLILSLALLTTQYQAQNIGINANGAAPDAGAMLDISSANKGLLIPRVNITNLAAIAPIVGSTTTSMLVYNTNATTGLGYHYWDGTKWVRFFTGNAWELTGNAGTNATTNFLGTTDNIALRIRTNNTNRFEFTTNGRFRSFNGGSAAAPTYSWTGDPNTGVYNPSADVLGFSTTGAERMRIAANGNVGVNATPNLNNNIFTSVQNTTTGTATWINTTSNSNWVTLEASATSTTQGTGVSGLAFTGVSGSTTTAAGWAGYFDYDTYIDWMFYTGSTLVSDQRLKTNINKIEDAIEILSKLKPVKYNKASGAFSHDKTMNSKPYVKELSTFQEFGFIAQDVEKVLPELVKSKKMNMYDGKSMDVKGVNYTMLIPITVQAIIEQQTIIEAQNAKIEALEKMVLELQKAIENK
ncbi:MAG: tail fiber domain-containing protein [Vicingaceae bacterium]|nr:tail fiber domain-containing protein [Vicingaceae bacterium]